MNGKRRRVAVSLVLLTIILTGCGGQLGLEGKNDLKIPRTVFGANGTKLEFVWAATHDRPGVRSPGFKTHLTVDSKGNVYLLDEVRRDRSAPRGLWLRKYKPDGRVAWTIERTSIAAREFLPQDIKVDSMDNIYVASILRGARNMAVLERISSRGHRIWRKNLALKTPSGSPVLLALDNQDDLYLTGIEADDWMAQVWLVKYGKTGNLAWRWAGERRAIPRGIVFYNGQVLVAVERFGEWMGNSGPLVFDPVTGRRSEGVRLKPRDMWRLHNMDGIGMVNALTPELGKNGFVYSTVQTGKLSAWFEAGPIRAVLAHAPERPGRQFAVAEAVAADKKGDAYVTVLRSGGNSSVLTLYKIRVDLGKSQPGRSI